MGFADRRYSQPNRSWRGSSAADDWTAVTTLIVLNLAVWVAALVAARDLPINDWLAMRGDLPRHLLQSWRLVTYGFAHDLSTPWHVGLNMLTLWFFGPEVEDRIGRTEFFRFWLMAIVVAGLTWMTSVLVGNPAHAGSAWLVGASGAVMATLAIYIWHNPHQELLLWGILPIPAWALGLLYFFSDVNGAYHGSGNVAHFAHIGGALFGLAYAWQGWNIGEWLEGPLRFIKSGRQLRVHRPEDDLPAGRREGRRDPLPEDDAALRDAVDRILEKISRSGESSLSPEERDTLTRASRRLKERLR
jgi:membrane associated rhomboid family serine protease